MANPVVGTVGFRINLAAGLDIAGGALTMVIVKPNGTVLTKDTVTVTQASGDVYYLTIAGDLDRDGVFKVRAKWNPSGSGPMYGDVANLIVEPIGG